MYILKNFKLLVQLFFCFKTYFVLKKTTTGTNQKFNKLKVFYNWSISVNGHNYEYFFFEFYIKK